MQLNDLNLKYIGALFLIFIIPSFLHIKFYFSHSDSFFISFFILSILIFKSMDFKKNNYRQLTFPCILISFVFLHGILTSLFNDAFNYARFFLSIIYLISIIFSAFLVYVFKYRINDQDLSRSLIIFAYILLILGYLSAFGINFSGAAGKPVFYFDEPCKFALISSPFFAFLLIKRPGLEAYLVYGLLFKLALMQPSITLLFSAIMWPFIFLKIKKSINFFILYVFIALMSNSINSNNIPLVRYFSERLPNKTFLFFYKSESHSNIDSLIRPKGELLVTESKEILLPESKTVLSRSLAVYYSGWARGLLNFIPTYGLGLGFQQLGYRGILDQFQILLYPLNLKDGATVGAKLFSEFGFFGIIFMLLYLKGLWEKVSNIRLLSSNINRYKGNHENLHIFLDFSYIAFFLLLFVRGAGYFDASFFLLLISLFYSEYKLLKIKNETL